MAIDETLARPVAVLTFAPGFPRLREVVTAARAASPRICDIGMPISRHSSVMKSSAFARIASAI